MAVSVLEARAARANIFLPVSLAPRRGRRRRRARRIRSRCRCGAIGVEGNFGLCVGVVRRRFRGAEGRDELRFRGVRHAHDGKKSISCRFFGISLCLCSRRFAKETPYAVAVVVDRGGAGDGEE